MIKIYGFKTKDIRELAEFVANGGMSGASLTAGFKAYAEKTGKAQGSVRNLYYALAKLSRENPEFTAKFLNGTPIAVEKPVRFSEEEKSLVEKLKEYKQNGVSVRKATLILANGDAKTALRLQNKYRSGERSCAAAGETTERTALREDLLRLKLKKEIDGLVDRIAASVRKENEGLKKQILLLRTENRKLYRELSGRESFAKGYFGAAERARRNTAFDG